MQFVSLTTLPNEFHVGHCLATPLKVRVIDLKVPPKPAHPGDHRAASAFAFVNKSGDHWYGKA